MWTLCDRSDHMDNDLDSRAERIEKEYEQYMDKHDMELIDYARSIHEAEKRKEKKKKFSIRDVVSNPSASPVTKSKEVITDPVTKSKEVITNPVTKSKEVITNPSANPVAQSKEVTKLTPSPATQPANEVTNSTPPKSSQSEQPFSMKSSPEELLRMYQEFYLLLNDVRVSDSTRDLLKKESREFVVILNTVSMHKQQIADCCQSVLSRLRTIDNKKVQSYMIYFITANLIQKGKDSREYSVCLSYSYLLHELASYEPRFTVMTVAGLYYECPFLIPELPKKPSVLDDKQFDEEITFIQRFVALFAGLFLYIPMNGKIAFPIAFAWTWLEKIMEQQKKRKSVEFSGVLFTFLEIMNIKLNRDNSEKMKNTVVTLANEILPLLEKIPGKTYGSVLRLEALLKKLGEEQYYIPDYCELD